MAFQGKNYNWAGKGVIIARGVGEIKLRLWNLMFIGAFVSVFACIGLIYNITVTEDAATEWIVWVFVFLGFALFVGGFLYENDYKKKHPEEFHPEYEGLEDA